jgi:DNA-binding beta-propeller fold protein YncE
MDLSSMQVITFAGTGTAATVDGVGTTASFNLPTGMAIDPSGLNLYVNEFNGNVVRRIVLASATVSTLAGSNTSGSADGVSASFNGPHGLVIDPTGTFLYVADSRNGRIRRIDIAQRSVTTVAGNGLFADSCIDGDLATGSFTQNEGIAIDPSGTILVRMTSTIYIASCLDVFNVSA